MRPLRRLQRPSAAAAEQQQQQQQRRRRAQEGASGGLGGGYEAFAAGEPLGPPGGVVGRRRESFQRSLRCTPVDHEKSWDRLMLFCRVVLVSVRPACAFLTLRTLLYTSVCVASCDGLIIIRPSFGSLTLPTYIAHACDAHVT